MESRFIKLPVLQSAVLAYTFEEIFNDEEMYMKYADIDEVFIALIGGDQYVFDLIERSCIDDVNSYAEAIALKEYLDMIRIEAEHLEYFEICHNCVTFMNKLETILTKTDEIYSRDCRHLSEC